MDNLIKINKEKDIINKLREIIKIKERKKMKLKKKI